MIARALEALPPRPGARGLLVLTAVVLALAWPSIGRARDVTIVPAADGSLGAWLVAGPTDRIVENPDTWRRHPRSGEKAFDAAFAPRWRALASRADAIDLAATFGVPAHRAGPTALLGAVLSAREPFSGLLLVGADGDFEVYLDGTRVFERKVGGLRDGAFEPVPIKVDAGEHTLIVRLVHRGRYWAFAARLLESATLLPPRGAVLRLPQTTERDRERLLDQLLELSASVEVEDEHFAPRLSIRFPRGAPEGPLAASASLTGKGSKDPVFDVRCGSVPINERGTYDLVVTLPPLLDAELDEDRRRSYELDARVDTARRRVALAFPEGFLSRLLRASKRLKRLRAGELPELLDRAVTTTTLEALRDRVVRAVRISDARETARASHALDSVLDALDAGTDPLAQAGRVLTLSHRSRLDGALHGFLLHVPLSYTAGGERRYPLVVALHGYKGEPEGVLEAFLGRLSAHPQVDGLVLAPEAFGDAFYRGPGEAEVMDLVAWAAKTYPVDSRRIAITGVSMGGTGAAHLAFRYAGRFAAAAPLAGYHSYFVRRDTAGKPLSRWERARMAHWSPASWADNGLYVPLTVAHGTRDFPLENSRVLTARYKALGYSLTEEWPDTGHAVWNVAYAGARLWPALSAAERPERPRKVKLVTDSLRYGESDWVRITGLQSRYRPARVRASLDSSEVTVETEHVRSLVLAPAVRSKHGPTVVRIDRDSLRVPAGAPLALTRRNDRWTAGATDDDPRRKRVGVEGPIRDVYLEPLAFVYGAGSPATTRANREAAMAFAERYGGSARYPVLPDSAAIPSHGALFLVGKPSDHALLQKWSGSLPIEVEGSALRFGEARHEGDDVGALFVWPNPDDASRAVVVLTAPRVEGIFRALSLPKLLPDFVLFDRKLSPAAGEQILGTARVLAAGFFDESWSGPELIETGPETASDPLAAHQGSDSGADSPH